MYNHGREIPTYRLNNEINMFIVLFVIIDPIDNIFIYHYYKIKHN